MAQTSIISSDSGTSTSRFGSGGDILISQMPSSKSRHIGSHKKTMLSASVEGVMKAAKSAMANHAYGRLLRKVLTSMMPSRATNSMIKGVWKEMPKTSGMKMAKPSHSLSRRS